MKADSNSKNQRGIRDLDFTPSIFERERLRHQLDLGSRVPKHNMQTGLKKGELPSAEEVAGNGAFGSHQPFLQMLQGESSVSAQEVGGNFGTNATKLTQNSKTQDSSTDMVIEFQDIGASDVRVTHSEGVYKVVLNVRDKSKIPSNPILFKNIIENQLANNFGVPIYLEIR